MDGCRCASCLVLIGPTSVAAYVKSQTLIGDSKHSEGVKIVEIVRANIPVKNGVVHFISKPLMIVDGTVEQFLKVSYKLRRRLLLLLNCRGITPYLRSLIQFIN